MRDQLINKRALLTNRRADSGDKCAAAISINHKKANRPPIGVVRFLVVYCS